MIEPLKNRHDFGNRDEAEAARLLGMLGPAAPPDAVEARVFANLGRPPRLAPRALRVATVTSVSLVTTGILAMTAGTILHRSAEPRVPASVPSLTAPSAPAPSLPAPSVAPPMPSALPQPAPVVIPEAPSQGRAEPRTVARTVTPRTPVIERHRAQAPSEPARPPVPATPPVPAVDSVESTEARVAGAPPEEAALVLAGLRALRRQHDPAQAGVLLARYLGQFPQGTLVQEALAISIEAGLARGDRKAAAHLAEQYLGRFPTGRFVRLARKAANSTDQ